MFLDTVLGKLEYRINNNYLGVAIIDDKLKDKNLVAACYLNGLELLFHSSTNNQNRSTKSKSQKINSTKFPFKS